VAFNSTVDEAAARAVIEIFTEVIIAPDYQEPRLRFSKRRKNLRVLKTEKRKSEAGMDYKQISGGVLFRRGTRID
jgi:phosphoribosylaminoimidazolecarboxamide formyltransferase/IMP cyclohydrolase